MCCVSVCVWGMQEHVSKPGWTFCMFTACRGLWPQLCKMCLAGCFQNKRPGSISVMKALLSCTELFLWLFLSLALHLWFVAIKQSKGNISEACECLPPGLRCASNDNFWTVPFLSVTTNNNLVCSYSKTCSYARRVFRHTLTTVLSFLQIFNEERKKNPQSEIRTLCHTRSHIPATDTQSHTHTHMHWI